ncbi:MAG: MBL fold metallo-hydrolase [Candidatus Thorarchaeota archaeon]
MTEQISLAKSLDQLYDTELGTKEFAFIYAGYAGILLRTKTAVVAFDPADLFSPVKKHIKSLDLITYSHSHYDHFSLTDAVYLSKTTGAQIISESSMAEDLRKKIPSENVFSGPEEFRSARDELTFEINGIKVKLHRGVHPRPIIQFRVSIGRLNVFHAADSGYWHIGKQKVDVAFLPTGVPSPTCHPGVALAMAMDLRPSIAVAVHGKDEQHKKFKELVEREQPETKVLIPHMNELVIIRKP